MPCARRLHGHLRRQTAQSACQSPSRCNLRCSGGANRAWVRTREKESRQSRVGRSPHQASQAMRDAKARLDWAIIQRIGNTTRYKEMGSLRGRRMDATPRRTCSICEVAAHVEGREKLQTLEARGGWYPALKDTVGASNGREVDSLSGRTWRRGGVSGEIR